MVVYVPFCPPDFDRVFSALADHTRRDIVRRAINAAHFGSALPCYERLFGRPPTMLPHAEEAAWRLTDTGWIYLVADADRAGKALLTLLVDNLDEQVAALPERGLAPTETETLPDAGLKGEAQLRARAV